MLDRDEDMCISGKRSPLLAKYKVGFSNDGIIKALDIKLYTNAGCTPDVSPSVSYELIAGRKDIGMSPVPLCLQTKHPLTLHRETQNIPKMQKTNHNTLIPKYSTNP